MTRTRLYAIVYAVVLIMFIILLIIMGREPWSFLFAIPGFILVTGFFGLGLGYFGMFFIQMAEPSTESSTESEESALPGILLTSAAVGLIWFLSLLYMYLTQPTMPDIWSGNLIKLCPEVSDRLDLLEGKSQELQEKLHFRITDHGRDTLPEAIFDSFKDDPEALFSLVKRGIKNRAFHTLYGEERDKPLIHTRAIKQLLKLNKTDMVNDLFIIAATECNNSYCSDDPYNYIKPYIKDEAILLKGSKIHRH